MEEHSWVKGRKLGYALQGKWGFSCHPAPPPPWLLVDVGTQAPLTGWACVKQGLGFSHGLLEWTWSCFTLLWFRAETQGVWSVFSWPLSTFSRAMYQDADIYLLDDLLSAVDAGVSRHLFEQWVCSCFLSSLLPRNPLCFRRRSLLCPGDPLSHPFPPQKIDPREILHHDEVRTGKYSRCFQWVEDSGVSAWGSEGLMVDFPCYLQLMDPDLRNKKDNIGFLNQRVRLHNLLLGCQLFSSIICLRHIRSEVFGAVIGLPWKGLIGLCLLFYQFPNKVFKSVYVC